MSQQLPFYSPNDRRPARDQKVKVRALDHIGTYLLPFLCQLLPDGTWINAENRRPLEVRVVEWRPFHATDRVEAQRPGRFTFQDVRAQQVSL